VPSASADETAADAPACFVERFEAFEVLAFDPAAVGRTAFTELDDFNAFDGGLWDACETAFPVCLFFALLPGLLAAVPRDFEGGLFAGVVDGARAVFPAEDLVDFLRIFLDIRLPFVAFRGSIIEVLRQAGIKPTAGQV
jgi:hypothetical protein